MLPIGLIFLTSTLTKAARNEFRDNGSDNSDKALIVVTDGWSTSGKSPYFHSNLALQAG